MIYIKRDEEAHITAASLKSEGPEWEKMTGHEPEVVLFCQGLVSGEKLAISDLALVRVLEDVIDLLIERGVIRFTDLPEPAQEKLSARRSARASIRQLNLLDEDDKLV
ncbi:hypothetical protein [Pseudothauera rhizosphaerae]|uniref:Tryptophan synthase subunit beta like protein n=1 Tax=Pseudothauera rhizosphaerae TaxID=2565932 RepID=A0A4S4A860_9RHOO|nr:hypothetical protein [Pseudothauera rhizosphaerae]THF54993.1 hypothetical protein E6O51_21245 [Pseudothauera rhizosphaerae]